MRIPFFALFLIMACTCYGQHLKKTKHNNTNFLTDRARYFAEISQTDSASFYFDEAIAVAKGLRDSTTVATLLAEKGKVHEMAGNYNQAINAYFDGLTISKYLNDKLNEGLCYLGLSNVNFRVANNEGAWDHGLMAMKNFQSLNDTARFIAASMLVGQIEISLGKLDEAFTIYNQMLSVAQKIGDSTLIADNLDHLGVIYTFRKEYSKALPYHEKALIINTKINNQFNLLINYANIGEVYMRMGNYNKGREYLMIAKGIGEKINANSVLIFVHYTLGECYSLMGQQEVAIENFNKSLELIDQQGEARERPYVFNLLAEHYERNRDYFKSLKFFRKFSTERDSLRITASTYAMQELKTKYEVDKRENDLRAALLENNLKETKLEHSSQTINTLFIAIGTALAGLVIVAVLSLRLYRSEKKLKRVNKTKDALLSIIGHDLRGPMGNINQLTKLIKSSEGKERDELIKTLDKPVHTALSLLDDLLEWSRSTRQESVSEKSIIHVNELINHSIELFREQADLKQIKLTSNIPDDIAVVADRNHVSSILRNLISNALKFTPKGGNVSISHNLNNGNVRISVKDSGLGIEPHHIKVILEGRFYSTYGTQNEKGSGLGLMLCREFVRLNNGSLSIESALGKGSIVSFTLPAQ